MPCSARHLHFGPQPDLEREPGWLVDGAHVETGGDAGDVCFTVTAHPDDIATVWPTGTPEALQTKASTGQGKDVRRARSQLAARGYVPVLLCGQQVERQRQRVRASASPGAGNPVTHRHRRHWRNQAHGPGRSLRKLVWVMPMLVGHHQSEAPESGHLYRMSPEDS